MTENPKKKSPPIARIKKISLILIALFLLYVIVGFWVIPPLLRPRLEKELASQFGRNVTIEAIKLNPLALSAATTRLTVYETDGEPFAGFEELFVNVQLASIVKWAITVKEIRLLAPFGVLKLLPDGKLNIDDILTKLSQPKPAPSPDAKLPPAIIAKLEVKDGKLTVEDLTLPKPARLTADTIQVAVTDLSTRKDSKADVDIALLINQAGAVTVEGTAGIDPLMADLKVAADKIALKSFQPYVDAAVNAEVTGGTTSFSGRITYRGKQGQPQIRFQGDSRVDGLDIKDRLLMKDFIELPQFKTSGIVLDMLPNKLHVTEVVIDKPHVRVTIDQKGTINVVQAFSPTEQKDKGRKQNLLQILVNFLILQFKGPMPMDVERVQLNNFSGDFVDRSVSPAYTTRLEIPKGTVKGISSAPSTLADFKLEGNIDQTATIESSGQTNPMNALHYTRVDFAMREFGLEPVSPYSGKFIGYKIQKGTLNLALNYQVEDERVDGNNRVRIDQLTLGDKVNSPDALKLPVALGIALLKDDKGRIKLQIPVKGSVKDPQFDLIKTIMSALTGTIDEVGNSPFETITEIDGFKGKDLRLIMFEFGLSELNARETRKLNALAKFLNERAMLTLTIQGTADRRMDWAGLKGESTEKKTSGDVQGAEKKPQENLIEGQDVDDKKLQELAQMRAEKVKTFLLQQGQVAAERIELKPVQIKSIPDGGYAQVELFLSAQ